MDKLMFLFAEALPLDSLVEELHKFSSEYLLTKSEESLKSIQLYSMLLLTKKRMENGGLEKTMAEFQQMKDREKLFTPSGQ